MIKIQKNKDKLISIISVIKSLIYECDISFTTEGVTIKAVHPSNSSMVIIKIKPSLFEEYNVESNIVYTLDMENLLKILKNLSGKALEIYPENETLILKDNKHEFKLNYFVGNEDERDTPTFENYSNMIELASKEFFDIIGKGVSFDQIGKFEIVDNKFFISSKSHLVSGKIDVDVTTTLGENISLYFDLSFIEMIKDVKKIFKKINLFMDERYPLTLTGMDEDISLDFILAGRIE